VAEVAPPRDQNSLVSPAPEVAEVEAAPVAQASGRGPPAPEAVVAEEVEAAAPVAE
jgi:hypothetical protein